MTTDLDGCRSLTDVINRQNLERKAFILDVALPKKVQHLRERTANYVVDLLEIKGLLNELERISQT